LLWLTGGFVGLHRFYVRSYWGMAYIPVFIGILYSNYRERLALDGVSEARRVLRKATADLDKAQAALDKGTAGATDALGQARDAAAWSWMASFCVETIASADRAIWSRLASVSSSPLSSARSANPVESEAPAMTSAMTVTSEAPAPRRTSLLRMPSVKICSGREDDRRQ
jgi:hypothetical protein